MSNIFDVAPPAWLQRLTQPTQPGEAGGLLGTLMAGGLNALQKDPNAAPGTSWIDSRKGFQEGLFEAKMNLIDPMWSLKAQQAELGIAGQRLQLQSAQMQIDDRKKEMAAWEKDAPQVTSWLTSIPQNPSAPPPTGVTSKAGILAVEKGVQFQTQLQVAKTRSQVNREGTKFFADSVRQLSGFDPSKAMKYGAYIGATNVPPQILDSLQAELTAAKAAAEKSAADSGLTPSQTVIGEKGATTTYKSAKDGDTMFDKPKEVTLSNGRKAVYNRKSDSIHLIDESGKEYKWTPGQLEKAIDLMPKTVKDEKGKSVPNPDRLKLQELVSQAAMDAANKMLATPAEHAKEPPAATKDPLGLFK